MRGEVNHSYIPLVTSPLVRRLFSDDIYASADGARDSMKIRTGGGRGGEGPLQRSRKDRSRRGLFTAGELPSAPFVRQ